MTNEAERIIRGIIDNGLFSAEADELRQIINEAPQPASTGASSVSKHANAAVASPFNACMHRHECLAAMKELAEANEAALRWYAAASPHATPEALKEGLRRVRVSDIAFERYEAEYERVLYMEKSTEMFGPEHQRMARRAMIELAINECSKP